MSKKNEKNAEKVVAKKTLTPVKKIEEPKAETPVVEAKTEEPVAETKTEAPVAEKIEAKRPEMPADFCMDPKDWTANGIAYDASSNQCGACKADFPVTFAACVARSEFLAALGKTGKVKKTKATGTPREKVAGAPTQTDLINSMLKEHKTIEEMVAATSADMKGRIKRHINSVLNGSCVSAALFTPGELDYLKKVKPAAEAPKAEAAKVEAAPAA